MTGTLIEYEPNPSSIPFHESTARIKALCGPMGSGKTVTWIMEWLFLCLESAVPLRGVVLRESYRQLSDSTRKTYMEWLGECSEYVKAEEVLRLTVPNCEGRVMTHELYLRHARREEEASNLLSTEYAMIVLEEPVPAMQESGVVGGGLPLGVFQVASGRLRQKGAHRRHLILSFNPPSKFHWVHRLFFRPSAAELAQSQMALFRQPPRENEVNLPAGYYDLMRKVMDPEMARRFVDGEIVTTYPGRPVWRSFSERLHFRDDLQPIAGAPFVLMIDFGLTPCCLFTQVSPTGRLLVLRETQLKDAGALDLAEAINGVMKDEFPGFKVSRAWGDPAGQQRAQTDKTTPFQILQKHGVPILPGTQSWHERWQAVDQRAKKIVDGEPAILIDPNRCSVLQEGLLGAYRFPKSADGKESSAPLKNAHSHLCDALQYGCAGEFSAVTGDSKHRQNAPVRELPTFDPLGQGKQIQLPGSWMTH